MAMLELSSIVLEEPWTSRCERDPCRIVFASHRVLKAITLGKSDVEFPVVEITNETCRTSVLAYLSAEIPQMTSPPPSCIWLPPNLGTSLGVTESPGGKLQVSLFRNTPPNLTELYLCEIYGSEPHSSKLHELCVSEFLKTSKLLSVGEIFGIPAWASSDRTTYNSIAEPSAGAQSWIGPGRFIDSTHDVVYYRVVSMTDGTGESKHGVASAACRVLMVAPRKQDCRRIPGMKKFLFPARKVVMNDQLVDWMKLPAITQALMVSKSSRSRVFAIQEAAESAGFFTEIIDCHSARSLHDRLFSVKDKDACIVVLDNFESAESFSAISVFAKKFRLIAVCEDFSLATKNVSSFFFSSFFDLSLDDSASRLEGYRHVLPESFDSDHHVAELEKRLSQTGESESTVESPNVAWEDIGGLEVAKQELRDLVSSGLRRGVLLYGPPGTGKTLLAKALATQAAAAGSCRLQFIGVKGPELLSMYIGESEKNVRHVFEKARKVAPCVVFFDELDSLAPARGRASDSANVMDRVVASLLSELDNLPPDVIIVAATNRPDLLDPALLRPGRIDRQVYVGVSEDKAGLLRALSRKFSISDDVVEAVSGNVPKGMTGSDLAGVLRKAYLESAKRVAEKIDRLAKLCAVTVSEFHNALMTDPSDDAHNCLHSAISSVKGELMRCHACAAVQVEGVMYPASSFKVMLERDAVMAALNSVAPSVSDSELVKYEELRDRRATVIG